MTTPISSQPQKDHHDWKNANVFVTGCTGFLGSWLTKALLKSGANVTCLVRDWTNHRNKDFFDGDNGINWVYGNLEDYALIERAINEYEIDTVFHLAAQAIVGVANRSPLQTFRSNIEGTWNILEACRQVNTIKRIVIASSDKAYGNQKELPYTEESPLHGTHPYDVSKSCADLISLTYHNTYNLPVAITRCGNLFGGGDLNFNRIIPGTIRSALTNEAPVIRSDGSPLRDYIYVEDAVDAYLLLAKSLDNPELHGQAFNFGTAQPLSVLEITKKVLELTDSDLQPIVKNEACGEILHQYLSSEKAGALLGWKPNASLDAGLLSTIQWYKTFFSKG